MIANKKNHLFLFSRGKAKRGRTKVGVQEKVNMVTTVLGQKWSKARRSRRRQSL